MSVSIPAPLNARLIAIVAALVLAATAALAAINAANSPANQPIVHTAIDRSGSINISGYDGGVSLSGRTRP